MGIENAIRINNYSITRQNKNFISEEKATKQMILQKPS